MYKKPYIFFFCFLIPFYGSSQSFKRTVPDPEVLINSLYRQQQSSDIAYQDFYESVYQFYLNPLDLNSANPEEMRNLYILNDVQIAELEEHIKKHGKLLSLYELQSIPSFTTEIIQALMPFVRIRTEETTWKGLAKQLQNPDQHYLILRHTTDIEKPRGYISDDEKPKAYQGDPNNLYARYRMQKYRSYSIGITVEKDAGESMRWAPSMHTYGFDYVSCHAMVYNRGRIKRIVGGDYQLQYGQGLVMSGGFFVGKGAETILTARRGSTGIRPYTSLLETNYLRGVAATIDLNRVEITPFVSSKLIDGTVVEDTMDVSDLASLRYTGLHRTSSELAARASVRETLYGVNTNYSSKNKLFQVGGNALAISYDKSIRPADRLYNLYAFKGRENSNFSLYYSYFWRNVSLFGEWGTSRSGGKGGVQGIMVALGQKIDLTVLYRNYSKDFHAPYGNSFGENYKNANELGIYWGFKFRLSSKTEAAAYYDTYKFPWLKYRVSAPSVGQEYLMGIKHKFSKKIFLFAQYRHEQKEKDAESERGNQRLLSIHLRENASLQLEYKADKHFYLRSKVQGSRYSQPSGTTYGFFIAQDIGYDGRRADLGVRMAVFDTDDFENRQYAYEKDVLFAFSFPFYSGSGMRQYAVARINLTRKLACWLKYGRTTYFDRTVIGSGYEEIRGNVKSEFRWECRYTFN